MSKLLLIFLQHFCFSSVLCKRRLLGYFFSQNHVTPSKKCQHCNFTSQFPILLMKHQKIHDDADPAIWSCKTVGCYFKTTASYVLASHMKAVHGEPVISCLLCQYECTTHEELNRKGCNNASFSN